MNLNDTAEREMNHQVFQNGGVTYDLIKLFKSSQNDGRNVSIILCAIRMKKITDSVFSLKLIYVIEAP